MEYATELINISKIKEGFYIGDRFAGTNLEVIMHFKITHIINAAAAQIINTFETIGIKYLSLIWSDNPNQKLFTSNDEIVDRIIRFIDDSLTKGEGLLVHSVKGQNRVCIVVIIYLMKKFKWGLMKCINFLNSKKADVNITKTYLSQLGQFEMRLVKMSQGVCTYSQDWNDDTIEDTEEILLRNTYVNGLPYRSNKKTNQSNIKKKSKPKIGWADFNPSNTRDTLIHPNPCKDLLMQKEIQPVTAHLRLRPSKSCVKGNRSIEETEKRADSFDNNIKQIKYQKDNNNEYKEDEVNINNNVNLNDIFYKNAKQNDKEQNQREILSNNHKNHDLNSPFPQSANIQRIKPKNNISNNSNNTNNEEKSNTSNDRNVAFDQNIRLIPSSIREDQKDNERINNFKTSNINNKKINEYINLPKRPSTVDRNTNNRPHKDIYSKKGLSENTKFIDGNIKGYIMKNSLACGFNSNKKKKANEHYNIESIQKPLVNSIEKKNSSTNNNNNNDNYFNDNQTKTNGERKIFIDNYVNDFTLKKNNSNDALLPYSSQMSKDLRLNYNLSANNIKLIHNYQPKIIPLKGNNLNHNQNYIFAYNKPLNNFDPSLMKKSQNMFLRSTHSFEKGPIKLSKECVIRKPLTPDQMLYINAMKPEKKKPNFNKNNYNEIYGTLVRKSLDNNGLNYFRPSTAPQKDKQKRKKSSQKQKRNNEDFNLTNPIYINPFYPPMKRLPSPMIQSSQLMHSKKLGTSSGFVKSPHLILKPNALSIDPYKSIPLIK